MLDNGSSRARPLAIGALGMAISSESSLSCRRVEMGTNNRVGALLDRQLRHTHGVVDRVYTTTEVETTNRDEPAPEVFLEQRAA